MCGGGYQIRALPLAPPSFIPLQQKRKEKTHNWTSSWSHLANKNYRDTVTFMVAVNVIVGKCVLSLHYPLF